MSDLRNLGDVVRGDGPGAERLALVDLSGPEPTRFSYRELDRLAGGVAAYLEARGLPRGSRVGIVALNRAEYVAGYLGVMRAGLVAVPLSHKLPAETIAFILADAEVRLVLADIAGLSRLPAGTESIGLDDPGPDGFRARITPADFPGVVPGATELAEILYTSGSSGRPKGVPLTHAGQIWALQVLLATRATRGERQLIAQPLFHMNGAITSCLAFLAEDTVYLQPAFRLQEYLAAIEEYRIERISAIPTMWARVLREAEHGRGDVTSVAALGLGSAPTTPELLTRTTTLLPKVEIALSYGTTEAGPTVFGPHPDGLPTPHHSLGYPLPGVELRLVDQTVPGQGTLQMRTPAVMSGYLGDPERTARVLDDGWYHTGDVVRHDPEGFYFFVGRADDMFVCGGENIYPGEVELLLERHPDIHQALVVPLPDEERGQIPVAFVVPRAGAGPTVADITAFALEHGAPHLHPRRIALVTELPLAGTNKVDRTSLTSRAGDLERNGGWSR